MTTEPFRNLNPGPGRAMTALRARAAAGKPVPRALLTVDLHRAADNIRRLRAHLDSARLMAVVKADAYGHGAVMMARTFVRAGASMLAVATYEEACELQDAGIDTPILILSLCDPAREAAAIRRGLRLTVTEAEQITRLAAYARKLGRQHPIHLKVETGMHRIGFPADADGARAAAAALRAAGEDLCFEGLFTHFACADSEDPSVTEAQFARYRRFEGALREAGQTPAIRHVCNSAATLRFPDYHLDMVRCGLISYGMIPEQCGDIAAAWGIRPVATFSSRISHVHRAEAGDGVSYGHRYHAPGTRKLATIAVGYADGYPRILGNRASVGIGDTRCPVVGNVCMDAMMADLTEGGAAEDEAVGVGSPVLLWGEDGDRTLPIESVSRAAQTIPYELACHVGRRVPRIYLP